MLRRRIIPIVLSLGLVAVGCGSDDDDDSAETTVAAATTPTTAATTQPPASEPADTEPAATEPADSEPADTEPEATEPADTEPASGGDEGAADDSLEPIKIGWVNVETGTPSFPDATVGIRAGVDYINAERGGIDGHPIELVECFVALDEESNQQCGQELANDDSVSLIGTGLILNGGSFYAAIEATGKPIIGRVPLTGADFTAKNTVFYGSGALGSSLGVGGFFALQDGVETVGILSQDSDAGRSSTKILQDNLEGKGFTVNNVVVDEASPDFAAAFAALGDIDGLYVGLTTPSCTQIAENPELVPEGVIMTGVSSCVAGAVWEAVPGSQEGWRFITGDVPLNLGAGADPELDTFLEKFDTYADGAQMLRFTNIYWGQALTLETLLQGVGADNITVESVSKAAFEFEGPVVMGPSKVSCPGTIQPTVCVSTVKAYIVEDNKAAVDGDGEEIDFAG